MNFDLQQGYPGIGVRKTGPKGERGLPGTEKERLRKQETFNQTV